jgi:hypothetical protein
MLKYLNEFEYDLTFVKGGGLAQAEGAKATGVIPGSQAECIQIRGNMAFMHKGTVDIILTLLCGNQIWLGLPHSGPEKTERGGPC